MSITARQNSSKKLDAFILCNVIFYGYRVVQSDEFWEYEQYITNNIKINISENILIQLEHQMHFHFLT